MHDDDESQVLLRQALPVTDMPMRAEPGDRLPAWAAGSRRWTRSWGARTRRPHPDHPSDAVVMADEDAGEQP
jgi:hypothetical protein